MQAWTARRVWAEQVAQGSATWSLTGTFAGFTSLTFDADGYTAVLEWVDTAWVMIGGNATTVV